MEYDHSKKNTSNITQLSFKRYSEIKENIQKKIVEDFLNDTSHSYLMEKVEKEILSGNNELLRYVLLHWLFTEKKELEIFEKIENKNKIH